MTNPGALNQRLVVEQPVETADDAGGVTRDYAELATVWAAVTPVSTHEDVAADHAGLTVTHRILMRARSDITVRHRLRKGARVWRIVGLREDDASGRILRIDAQERLD